MKPVSEPTPLTKDTAQMSPRFQKLVEDVAEWKKSRGELAYHVQEEVKSILEQERQKVREETVGNMLSEAWKHRFNHGDFDDRPIVTHGDLVSIGGEILSQPKKEQGLPPIKQKPFNRDRFLELAEAIEKEQDV